MDGQTILAAGLTLLATVSGVVLGWTGRVRDARRDIKKEAVADALLKSDLDYVKRGIDEIRLAQQAQGQKLNEVTERLIRLEESDKLAHKRLDRLEGADK